MTAVTIDVPPVPYPGGLSDAHYLRVAARNLREGYPVGGSNVTETVAELLDRLAAALDAPVRACPVCGRTDITVTKSGGMRHHNGDMYRGGWQQVCAGVGQPPVAPAAVTP